MYQHFMRIVKITKGEYYHIYLRGNNKQLIFHDDKDRVRFLFLILYLQSPTSFPHVGRFVHKRVKHSVFDTFDTNGDIENKVVINRFVELVNFSLMPNHFHLTVFEKETGGISRYMQKVLNAYTKYYNTRYETSGHLFAGPFQYRHIKTENLLSYISAYVHRNISELKKWKGKEHLYKWSSFQDYVSESRWGQLLKNEIIMKKFNNGKEYEGFVKNSGAKISTDKNVFND